MSRFLLYKKYIQANFFKTILPYLVILVFLLIFQGYFAFYNGTSKKVEKAILQEKDLIIIKGSTNVVNTYNVYDRLKEETTVVVIPYETSQLKIDEVSYQIIATSEDYLNYFIDEYGSYNDYALSFDVGVLNNDGIVLNKKAHDLIANTNLLINGQNFNVHGYYHDSNDNPVILLNYRLYDQYIKPISETLLDGEKSYHFSRIYVVSSNKQTLKTIKEIYNYEQNEKHFQIITFKELFNQQMIDKGIGNSFTKNMLIFVFLSMVLVLAFIISMSYKRKKTDYLLRKIVGENNRFLFIEFMIENLVVGVFMFLLSVILVMITTIITSQFSNSILLPTFKQQIFILGGIIVVNQFLSAIVFHLFIPKKNIISRR